MNNIKGTLSHELRKDEPLKPFNPKLIGRIQNPTTKIIKRTKNNAITDSNINAEIDKINAGINNMNYKLYKGISESLEESNKKLESIEDYIEEYGGSTGNFLDEMDNPLTQQEGYKRLIDETNEMISIEIKGYEDIYKENQQQIRNIDEVLNNLRLKIIDLIKEL